MHKNKLGISVWLVSELSANTELYLSKCTPRTSHSYETYVCIPIFAGFVKDMK
jgi:hypothetical protein